MNSQLQVVLLHTVFECVAIVKPVTSRPASAERFLVCMGLLAAGDALVPVLNRLRAVCYVLRSQPQQQQQYNTSGGDSSSQWQECSAADADSGNVYIADTTGSDTVAAAAPTTATATATATTVAAAVSSSSSDDSMQELCLIDPQLFAQINRNSNSTSGSSDSCIAAVSNVVQYLRAVNDALLQLQVAACSAILTEADSGRFHDHESSIEYAVRHKRESTLQAACVQAWRLQ
jgi:hypothetical protein